jgi:hypothetical protein
MVITPRILIERKQIKDRKDVIALESKIDKFLDANFDGTREVAHDLPLGISREAIQELVSIYSNSWKVYHWTGVQWDSCNRLIFNYKSSEEKDAKSL